LRFVPGRPAVSASLFSHSKRDTRVFQGPLAALYRQGRESWSQRFLVLSLCACLRKLFLTLPHPPNCEELLGLNPHPGSGVAWYSASCSFELSARLSSKSPRTRSIAPTRLPGDTLPSLSFPMSRHRRRGRTTVFNHFAEQQQLARILGRPDPCSGLLLVKPCANPAARHANVTA